MQSNKTSELEWAVVNAIRKVLAFIKMQTLWGKTTWMHRKETAKSMWHEMQTDRLAIWKERLTVD